MLTEDDGPTSIRFFFRRPFIGFVDRNPVQPLMANGGVRWSRKDSGSVFFHSFPLRLAPFAVVFLSGFTSSVRPIRAIRVVIVVTSPLQPLPSFSVDGSLHHNLLLSRSFLRGTCLFPRCICSGQSMSSLVVQEFQKNNWTLPWQPSLMSSGSLWLWIYPFYRPAAVAVSTLGCVVVIL